MRKLRGKLLVLLVVYFAGFATAIYGLAPVDQSAKTHNNDSVFNSFTKSDEFALNCGRQFKKWACLAEDAALRAGDYIQSKTAGNKIMGDTINITGANRTTSDGVNGVKSGQ